MNFSRPLSAFALLALCAQDMTTVSGLVVDAADRSPLAGVHIKLVAANERQTVYGDTTDDKGRFSFGALPPGIYAILPLRAGMTLQGLDGTSVPLPIVSVKSGVNQELRIAMVQKAVISGRVTDDAGLPVDSARITLEPEGSGAMMTMAMMQMQATVATDDRGEFRMSAPPGKFYLKAGVPTGEKAIGASANNIVLTQVSGTIAGLEAKANPSVQCNWFVGLIA